MRKEDIIPTTQDDNAEALESATPSDETENSQDIINEEVTEETNEEVVEINEELAENDIITDYLDPSILDIPELDLDQKDGSEDDVNVEPEIEEFLKE